MSRRRKSARASRAVTLLLALAVVVMGAFLWRIYPEYRKLRSGQADSAPTDSALPPPKPFVARLFFARVVEGKQRLVAISRELPSGLAPARSSLEELLRGEVPRGCDRPRPRGTALLGVRAEDGLVIADFSEQLVSGFQGGSDNEGVAVYAIVNTLTSLPGVKRVQLLVEGERVDTIGGHLDTSGPLSHDDELVVSHP